MAYAVGESRRARGLKNILSSESLSWQLATLLLGVGFTVVLLHAEFRLPLRLPGRHGLEWMAMLIMVRSASKYRWAASVSSWGAAAFSLLPLWGFGDPLIPLTYFIPGVLIDVVFNASGRWQGKLWFLACLGAIAHATKPLVQFVISSTSHWVFNSLLYGLAYPVAMHLMFGFVGAFIGAGLVLRSKKADPHSKMGNP